MSCIIPVDFRPSLDLFTPQYVVNPSVTSLSVDILCVGSDGDGICAYSTDKHGIIIFPSFSEYDRDFNILRKRLEKKAETLAIMAGYWGYINIQIVTNLQIKGDDDIWVHDMELSMAYIPGEAPDIISPNGTYDLFSHIVLSDYDEDTLRNNLFVAKIMYS